MGRSRDHPPSHPLAAAADTVFWLDLPRHVVMTSLVGRTLRRVITREELWNGNRRPYETSSRAIPSDRSYARSAINRVRNAKLGSLNEWRNAIALRTLRSSGLRDSASPVYAAWDGNPFADDVRSLYDKIVAALPADQHAHLDQVGQ